MRREYNYHKKTCKKKIEHLYEKIEYYYPHNKEYKKGK